eukprot:334985-Hanusia_phi.AAC.3
MQPCGPSLFEETSRAMRLSLPCRTSASLVAPESCSLFPPIQSLSMLEPGPSTSLSVSMPSPLSWLLLKSSWDTLQPSPRARATAGIRPEHQVRMRSGLSLSSQRSLHLARLLLRFLKTPQELIPNRLHLHLLSSVRQARLGGLKVFVTQTAGESALPRTAPLSQMLRLLYALDHQRSPGIPPAPRAHPTAGGPVPCFSRCEQDKKGHQLIVAVQVHALETLKEGNRKLAAAVMAEAGETKSQEGRRGGGKKYLSKLSPLIFSKHSGNAGPMPLPSRINSRKLCGQQSMTRHVKRRRGEEAPDDAS